VPGARAAALHREIERTALEAYHALGCRDWCRVDLRVDRFGVPNVLELNPLPGIIPDPAMNSCFPKAARAAGFSYDELIQEVVRLAWRRLTGRELAVGAGPPPCRSGAPTGCGGRVKVAILFDPGPKTPADHHLPLRWPLSPSGAGAETLEIPALTDASRPMPCVDSLTARLREARRGPVLRRQ